MDKRFWQLYDLLMNEQPRPADAVIWLQGDRLDRGKKALEIYRQKYADFMVISGNDSLIGPGKRPNEDNISLTEMEKYLIENEVPASALIIDKNSFNTKDQAVNITRFSKKMKWKSIILVSSSYNQPRAFLTFLKQLKEQAWPGIIYNQPFIIDMDTKPSGRNTMAKELVLEEIEKIAKYKNDLSSLEEGLEYLTL